MNNDELQASLISQLFESLGGTSVTSVSGGKSSAYMALNYPTDYYVFSVVLTRDPACRITDKGLLQAVRQKVPQFEGSRELDQTLVNVLRLEQEIGREIVWVYGPTFEDVILQQNSLPNPRQRFCTSYLKVLPIWYWCYTTVLNPVLDHAGDIVEVTPCKMHIGYRYDEKPRVYKGLGAVLVDGVLDWSSAGSCEVMNLASLRCDIAGKYRGKHRRLRPLEWRYQLYPMWHDYIERQDVVSFWNKKGWVFPEVSNCDYCFFHRSAEQKYQYSKNPERAEWWMFHEHMLGHTFRKESSLSDLLKANDNDDDSDTVEGHCCGS